MCASVLAIYRKSDRCGKVGGPPVDPKIDHPQAPKVDGIQIGEVGGESGLVFISGLTFPTLAHLKATC